MPAVVATSGGQRDAIADGEFVVTDWTSDLTLDCDSDDADLGDLVGTLIKQLIEKGIIKGSVTSK